MSQYANLYVSNYQLIRSQHLNPQLLTLFRSDEIESFERDTSERIEVFPGVTPHSEQAFVVKATAAQLKDRLEIMGFTLPRVEKRINGAKVERISELNVNLHEENRPKEYEPVIKAEIKLLQESTFKDFLNACAKLVNDSTVESDDNPLLSYLKKGIERFPHDYEERFLLRAVLEVVPDDTLITYDITELIDTGYFDPDDPEEIFDEFLAETKSEDILREK